MSRVMEFLILLAVLAATNALPARKNIRQKKMIFENNPDCLVTEDMADDKPLFGSNFTPTKDLRLAEFISETRRIEEPTTGEDAALLDLFGLSLSDVQTTTLAPERAVWAEFGDVPLKQPDSGHLSTIGEEQKLWPNGRIPTVIEPGMTQYELTYLYKACKFFSDNTCIRFVQPKPDDNDYLNITKTEKRCFSDSLGNTGGAQRINLEENSGCWKHGTIIHEIMHKLGFFHEHARNDRYEHIILHWWDIPESLELQFKTAAELGIPQKLIGEYDFNSIMHYPRILPHYTKPLMSSIDEPKSTNNGLMGNRVQPTEMDIRKINTLYQCPGKEIHSRIFLTGTLGASRVSEFYVPGNETRSRLVESKMLEERYGHAMGALGNYVVLAGGTGKGEKLKSTEYFDLQKETFTKGPDMNVARYYFPGVVLDDLFYVFGGWGEGWEGQQGISDCERLLWRGVVGSYWEDIAPLNTRRYNSAAVVVHKDIYVLGGWNYNISTMALVEKYAVEHNNWSYVSPMQTERSALAAAVYGDFIFACGGYSEDETCEEYDSYIDQWSYIASMKWERTHHCMVAFNELVYVLGGCCNNTVNLETTVEVYNPKNDSWTEGRRLLSDRWMAAAVVL